MIHFTCDVCKRELEPEDDLRYVVKIEVYPALASGTEDFADERDHLEELQNALQDIDDGTEPIAEDEVYQQMRYDLCAECRRKFLKNPIGAEAAKVPMFSKN